VEGCAERGEPSLTATGRRGHGLAAARTLDSVGQVHAAWPARRPRRQTGRSRPARCESRH